MLKNTKLKTNNKIILLQLQCKSIKKQLPTIILFYNYKLLKLEFDGELYKELEKLQIIQ